MSCAPLAPGAGGSNDAGLRGAAGLGDERVAVGNFATIEGVAVSRRFVYALGRGGLAVYDRYTDRWRSDDQQLALQAELGRAATLDARTLGPSVTVMTGDPADDALWLGVPGAVIVYRPLSGQLQRTLITGVPQRIVFDRGGTMSGTAGDALVQSGGQWTRVSRVGLATPTAAPVAAQVYAPPTAGDLAARYPGLRVLAPSALRADGDNTGNAGAALRPARAVNVRSAAAAPDRTNELWLGTDAHGLVQFDPVFGRGRSIPYGLLTDGAGALAPAANGFWVAGVGPSGNRGGLTFASWDLQRWQWLEGTVSAPLVGLRSFAMATRAAMAWVGTDRGLVELQLDGPQAVQVHGRFQGLPDDRVFAVAPRDEGSWAGTARGLAFVPTTVARGAGDVARLRTLLDGVAVFALQATGSTLWAGTARGLLRLFVAPDSADRAVATSGTTHPALRRPVRALAASDSVLLVSTDVETVLLLPRPGDGGLLQPGAVMEEPALRPERVGEPTRVAVDDRVLALAGRDGVVLRTRHSGAERVLRVPADLPGPALDLLLHRDWLVVATPQGLVRWRRTRDGLVP